MRIGSTVVALVGAAVLGTGCGGSEAGGPAPRAFTGSWISDSLPTTTGTVRVARFEVRADTEAVLSMEFVGRGTVFQPGYWHARGAEITLQPVDLQQRPSAIPLVWRLEGERLVPVRWNKDLYGAVGVPLRRWVPPAAPAAADTTKREEGR